MIRGYSPEGTANLARTILVTGVAGFIGSHLAAALIARGDRVVGVDDFCDFYDPRIKWRNLNDLAGAPGFQLFQGDIRDAQLLEQAFRAAPIDTVVHLAAMPGVAPSLKNPPLYQDVNVRGTLQLLDAMRASGTRKLLFASSSSVYGRTSKLPFTEADPADQPVSPYAATKRAGELLCHVYHDVWGLDVTCLRFFTVYGPRQRPDLAIHRFTRLIEEGTPVTIFGDGSASRDYTYVDDILDGVLKALDRDPGFAVYNLGESRPIGLLELLDHLGRALGKKPQVRFEPERPGDVHITYADISRARAVLGYAPAVGIEEGLERFVAWFRTEARALAEAVPSWRR
jgi:UDP-glucuronate 4-epimerase